MVYQNRARGAWLFGLVVICTWTLDPEQELCPAVVYQSLCFSCTVVHVFCNISGQPYAQDRKHSSLRRRSALRWCTRAVRRGFSKAFAGTAPWYAHPLSHSQLVSYTTHFQLVNCACGGGQNSVRPVLSSAPVERIWHIYDSQGQILALAFGQEC